MSEEVWCGLEERTMGTYHIPAQHQGQRRNDSIIHQQARWWWLGWGTPRRIWHERKGLLRDGEDR